MLPSLESSVVFYNYTQSLLHINGNINPHCPPHPPTLLTLSLAAFLAVRVRTPLLRINLEEEKKPPKLEICSQKMSF